MKEIPNHRRILVIDDTESIHGDFHKILGKKAPDTVVLDDLESSLFGDNPASKIQEQFKIDDAFQGQDGLERVKQSLASEQPYSLAFVDMRMPPGWDGVETVEQIWKTDPNLQIVICTAYSDYSWEEIRAR